MCKKAMRLLKFDFKKWKNYVKFAKNKALLRK